MARGKHLKQWNFWFPGSLALRRDWRLNPALSLSGRRHCHLSSPSLPFLQGRRMDRLSVTLNIWWSCFPHPWLPLILLKRWDWNPGAWVVTSSWTNVISLINQLMYEMSAIPQIILCTPGNKDERGHHPWRAYMPAANKQTAYLKRSSKFLKSWPFSEVPHVVVI